MVCSLVLIYYKNKLNKTSNYWFRDIINFLEKILEIVFFLLYFVYDFSRKMFLMLQSINWPNFIASLPLFLEVLGSMYIVIVCHPSCDVINFRIKLISLIKPFFCTTKKSRHKSKYLENGKIFQGEIKSIFHHFKKASSLIFEVPGTFQFTKTHRFSLI